MINWELFITFLKIGSFSFGGGYTLAPLIEREFIVKRPWMTRRDLLEIISISQMTPGVIAINTATFVGKKAGGIKGAIIASIGVSLPSLFIISFIIHFLSDSFGDPVVTKALTGIRAGAIAMIFYSVIGLLKTGADSLFSRVIFIFSLILLIYTPVSPILLISGGGVLGIVFYRYKPGTVDRILQKETI